MSMTMFIYIPHIFWPLTSFSSQVCRLDSFIVDVIGSLVESRELPYCSCHVFEYLLILCCHLIAFFNHQGLMELLREYVKELENKFKTKV